MAYGMCISKVRIFFCINIHILPIQRSAHPHIRTFTFYPWPIVSRGLKVGPLFTETTSPEVGPVAAIMTPKRTWDL